MNSLRLMEEKLESLEQDAPEELKERIDALKKEIADMKTRFEGYPLGRGLARGYRGRGFRRHPRAWRP